MSQPLTKAMMVPTAKVDTILMNVDIFSLMAA
jgi:hypothetical protein